MAPVHYHKGKFPPSIESLDMAHLLPLIGPANAAVARYDGVLHGIPDADVLLSPLMAQEAVLSSKIEGTQATLGEVLEFEAAEETATGAKRDDIQEVLNYRKAMRRAVELLNSLPLSQRLIRNTHEVLLEGVRGTNKAPGEYRRVQNWIGPAGTQLEGARYVPPSADQVPELMSGWERYVHEDAPDKLLQLAILHAEFEAIHPFLDGNGRIGRLLVPLFLMDKGLLSSPSFYVSGYLEARRDEYYERLLAVSRDGDWTRWCAFFLAALKEQAQANERKAKAVQELYEAKKTWIVEQTHSQYAVKALDWFFGQPIFATPTFIRSVDIPERTAKRLVREARDGGLLHQVRPRHGRSPAVYCFPELLEIAEGKSLFVGHG